MSESEATTTTETVEITENEGEQTAEVFDEARAREKIKKTNAEAAALRKRVKALEVFEQQAQAAEQAKLSDSERFTAQLAEATKRAETAEKLLLRTTVARRAGLPDELVDRLVGDDEEALEADAQRLAELFGEKQAPSKPVRRADPSQGSDALALNGDPLLDSLKTKLGIR
jgi:hypothetical protein